MAASANKYGFYGDEDSENSSPVKPERNLLAAVLARAICDAFGTAQCERHVVRSARQWIFSEMTPTIPFSFAWLALQLDLEPAELQVTLRGYECNPDGLEDKLALLK